MMNGLPNVAYTIKSDKYNLVQGQASVGPSINFNASEPVKIDAIVDSFYDILDEGFYTKNIVTRSNSNKRVIETGGLELFVVHYSSRDPTNPADTSRCEEGEAKYFTLEANMANIRQAAKLADKRNEKFLKKEGIPRPSVLWATADVDKVLSEYKSLLREKKG